MPRGQAGTGTRGKRTAQKRSQNSGNSQAGFPAAAHKQLNAFGKKLDTLQSNYQTLMTNIGGQGTTGGRGGGGSTRNQQSSQNL